MIRIEDKKQCTGCSACVNSCPKNCITMQRDKEGFLYPSINSELCIECGLCEKVCPVLHDKTKEVSRGTAYACLNTQEHVREKSSSGGVFTVLANYIIERGGVVFGAAFDDDFQVVHKRVDKIEDLDCLRGSKYVQSKIGDTYQQAKKYLQENRLVLFTGTPCQIGGLYAYLGRDYENLYTQDLICHGAPSPMVWDKYVAYRTSMENDAKPRKIAFRAKNEGWKRYSVSFVFDNDTEYRQTLDKDLYMNAFLQNLCLRPSCYQCAFKGLERESDITLADFWGIQNVMPEMDDDKGTSLVIIQSEKGEKLFKEVSKNLEFKQVDLKTAVKYNSSMIASCATSKNREKFLYEINSDNFETVTRKYSKVSLKQKIRRILGKIKRKLFKK